VPLLTVSLRVAHLDLCVDSSAPFPPPSPWGGAMMTGVAGKARSPGDARQVGPASC